MARRPTGESIGLPPRPFLYTLDQIALMLAIKVEVLKAGYIYYEGRSTGLFSVDQIRARNIAPRHERPEWRVSQVEFMRWLQHKGFRIYETGGSVG